MGGAHIRAAGALLLAAALAVAWQPGSVAAESRRRGPGRAASGEVRSGEGDRLEQAVDAAERAGVARREVRELLELCERGGFTGAQTARILSLAAQLSLEELPVPSFAAKIGEGVSKHADPERIIQVAERRALLLNQAKSLLNGILLDGAPVRDREELIPDVAEALEAGASADDLGRELEAGFTGGESIGEIRQRIFP